jgi:hypothetical protein
VVVETAVDLRPRLDRDLDTSAEDDELLRHIV